MAFQGFKAYPKRELCFSQRDMENWFREKTENKEKFLRQKGVIEELKPSFVSCDFEKGESIISFPTQNWQKNPHAVVHGGILSTCFHTTMDMLCSYYVNPQKLVVSQFSVSFLKPVFVEDTMMFHSQIQSLGNSLVFAKAELFLKSTKEIAAMASGVLEVCHCQMTTERKEER